jgi:hypothetical protein
MQKPLLFVSLAAVTGLALFARPAETGQDLQKRYRLRRLSDATSMASPPAAFAPGGDECPLAPGVPEAIGPNFDPANYDEISLAGDGKMVAYATATALLPAPGNKVIIVLREGNDTVTISEGAGGNDQPSIELDRLGWRTAFRGPGGAANATSTSDIYLYTHTTRGDGLPPSGEPPTYPVIQTRNLTDMSNGVGTFARDPSIAARTVVSDFKGSGNKFVERDARVAFISDGDFDKGGRVPNDPESGRNELAVEQLFVWREMGRRFNQITRNTDPEATMARPSMSTDARSIAFECTGDLLPEASNPRDPAQTGNPNAVRQIYLWRDSAKGGRLRQLTFGDRDCFSPRIAHNGSEVLFCSQADLLPGGNPEGNYEIFSWRRGAPTSRRLAQRTQTIQGDSVLPRQLRSARRFVFFSTAKPPGGGAEFGLGLRQCGPTALLWSRGRVKLVAGLLDAEQPRDDNGDIDPARVIAVGPPAARFSSKVHFVTNDPKLDPPASDGNATPGTANLAQFHLGRAIRFRRP